MIKPKDNGIKYASHHKHADLFTAPVLLHSLAELGTSWYNSFKCFYAAIQMLLLAKQDNKMYTKVYSEILICP